MNTTRDWLIVVLICLCSPVAAEDAIELKSPGLAPSSMDPQGRLIEDWANILVTLSGNGIVDGPTTLEGVTLADCVPAARACSEHGVVAMTRTVYRAPVFPAGVDVLTVELKELKGAPTDAVLTVSPSVGIQMGSRTARLGGRVVLVLPGDVVDNQPLLDWGFCDEAQSLPGWARPAVKCDPAFRNIRAGMGGVPIIYRFAVPAGSQSDVILGLCESHWDGPGQRPMTCRVEGADPQTIDPVAQWGQHQPGLLKFAARDANGDGRLEVLVRPAPGAPDRNPILNAIWVFGAGATPPLDHVLSGASNDAAQYFVDVGGQKDQSIFPSAKLEFPVHLEAGATAQLTFLVACPGGSAPLPTQTRWDADSLLRAAHDVWRDWQP